MALVYQADFRTLANQTIGAAGAYTIDGKTWWAKGQLTDGAGNTIISNVVNGSGIHFDVTAGGGTTPLTSGANPQVWRHLWLPFSQFPEWSAGKAYMVRARFQKNGLGASSKPFVGVTSTTDDSVGLTAAQRPGEFLVAPNPQSGTTADLSYKLGSGVATTATGRAGTILNNECVVAIYHFTPRFALIGSEFLASGMPTDPASWLAVQTVATADFDGLRSNPGVLLAQDSGNNDWYLQQLRIETIGDALDLTAPTVTLVSPTELTKLRRFQPIVFDVTDPLLGFHMIGVIFDSLGVNEWAYDSADPTLSTPYVVARTTVADGWRYTVYRRSGWPAPPRLRVRATDGNVT
jgi:hypothetical protein